MAQSSTTSATQDWTEITDANITRITIQNQGLVPLEVKATTGATPTDSDGAIVIPENGILINEYLADLFPGVAGADRVFIRGSGNVFFSHA